MDEADHSRLIDILEAAQTSQEFIAGKTRASLDEELMLSLALTRLIEIMGEAAGRVSQQTREALPQIPWRNMIGMRNRVVHDYGNVNHDILWNTVSVGIPELITVLEAVLSSDSPPTE